MIAKAPDCPFCGIAYRELEAVVLYEDDALMAFLDRSPIRPGHTQVITKTHVATFDVLPLSWQRKCWASASGSPAA